MGPNIFRESKLDFSKTFLRLHFLTRNQEIFGQKLADYAVDCLWILVIVMQ